MKTRHILRRPLAWSLGLAYAHNVQHEHTHEHTHDERCATREPTLREELLEQMRFQAFAASHSDKDDGDRRHLVTASCEELCDQCIEIETHLHLIEANVGFGAFIPHPTATVARLLNDPTSVSANEFTTPDELTTLFQANIAVVNDAFVGTPFRFRFVPEGTTRTVNNDWSNNAVDFQADMSRAVGVGDLQVLDVFWAFNLQSTQGGIILGIASLPAAQIAGEGDSILMRYDVITNGGLAQNDLGYTMVHEIGHWLGLLHTFQKLVSDIPCDADEEGYGDFVDDTPFQDGPSSSGRESCIRFLGGTRPLPDTCPDLPGVDPIFNYMNYVDDEFCQQEEGEFTCSQIERMFRHWTLFREHVTSCDDVNEMEIEVVIELDEFYIEDNVITLVNDQEQVLFNSIENHLIAFSIFDTQETLFMDVCVPRDRTYELRITDDNRDGFVDGSIEVFVDRILIARVEGNFGPGVIVPIAAGALVATLAPTAAPSVATLAPTSAPSVATLAPTADSTSNDSTSNDNNNALIIVIGGVVVLVLLLVAAVLAYCLCARSSGSKGERTRTRIVETAPPDVVPAGGVDTDGLAYEDV